MSNVVDAVARAICNAEGDNPSEYRHYRAPAQAAIDAYRKESGLFGSPTEEQPK